MTIDEIKKLYDSLCTPMDSYLGAVEQVQARHLMAAKAFPFLIEIAMAASNHKHICQYTIDDQAECDLCERVHKLEEAKL